MRIPAATFAATIFVAASSAAFAQNVNVRGTITSFDGHALGVKTLDQRDVIVAVPDGVNIATTKPFTLAEIKPGMKLGVTTVKRPDGTVVAIDVRPISATAREGLSSYDLQPQSTMTNAAVEASVADAKGHELTLNYASGTVKVLVPPGTPMSRSAPGTRADLKTGETVFAATKRDEAGKLTALRVQVSKDGVKPTQ
jgi:hypothetical protein